MSRALSPKSYIRKAESALSGARVLLQSGDSDGACSRAYYAMFDAAHAALFALRAEDFAAPIKTHNGLVARFGQHVVATGQLAAEHGSDLNKVQNLRQLADYSGEPVDIDKAAWAVERAEAFVAAVKGKFEPPRPPNGRATV
jgi:uncharacterized protein (UPF0332 family)